MLLVCAYAHDYGMSYTYDKVYKVLGSDDFKKFIEERDSKPSELEKEDVTAVKNLMEYLNGSKKDLKLQELY